MKGARCKWRAWGAAGRCIHEACRVQMQGACEKCWVQVQGEHEDQTVCVCLCVCVKCRVQVV